MVEPCGIDILTSVGIWIGFLLNCRFSAGLGSVTGLKKVVGFYHLLGFFVFFKKLFFAHLAPTVQFFHFVNINMAQETSDKRFMMGTTSKFYSSTIEKNV
jgi:hypothetical protein